VVPASRRTLDHHLAVPAGRPEDWTASHYEQEQTMSTLAAVAYPDFATAEKVRQELIDATKEHLLQLEDAVIVEHQADGKIKLHQVMGTTGAGAAGGAMWGGLIGLLFLAPLVGMAVGAASGAAAGKMTDLGVNDNFVKDLGSKLEPGTAALIVLGSTDARDKVIDRVKPYGGDVIQTSLSTEEEEHLRAALAQTATVA
jgi:uncharacterized membrane protein